MTCALHCIAQTCDVLEALRGELWRGVLGADVNKATTNNDHTVLSLACAGGHLAVVELLLKSGAKATHKLKVTSAISFDLL